MMSQTNLNLKKILSSKLKKVIGMMRGCDEEWVYINIAKYNSNYSTNNIQGIYKYLLSLLPLVGRSCSREEGRGDNNTIGKENKDEQYEDEKVEVVSN